MARELFLTLLGTISEGRLKFFSANRTPSWKRYLYTRRRFFLGMSMLDLPRTRGRQHQPPAPGCPSQITRAPRGAPPHHGAQPSRGRARETAAAGLAGRVRGGERAGGVTGRAS